MRIYIAHSKLMNYQEELYKPLRNDSFFDDYELILPHEFDANNLNDYAFYQSIDVFIADCSESSTGLGIELGLMYKTKTNIYCIHQVDKKLSNSLKFITDVFYPYKDIEEMIDIIKKIIIEQQK